MEWESEVGGRFAVLAEHIRTASSSIDDPLPATQVDSGSGVVVSDDVPKPVQFNEMEVDELERQAVAAKRASERAEEQVRNAKSARSSPYGRSM